jgi:hypothetical protein
MTTFNAKPEFYRHSGKVPLAAFLIGIPISLIAGGIIGALDGLLGFWSHLIPSLKGSFLVELLLTMGVGFALGMIPVALLRGLKARSMPAIWGLTLLTCSLAYYVSWVCWTYAFGRYVGAEPELLFLARPDIQIEVIQGLNAAGTWYLFDDVQPRGAFLALIWLIEIATIFGIALYWGHTRMKADVFCEHCRKWGTRQQLTQIRTADVAALRQGLIDGNFEVLASAQRKLPTDTIWCVVDLEGCAQCDNLQTLVLDECRETTNSEGKASIKVNRLIRRLLLTPEQTVQLAMMAAANASPDDTPTDPSPTDPREPNDSEAPPSSTPYSPAANTSTVAPPPPDKPAANKRP